MSRPRSKTHDVSALTIPHNNSRPGTPSSFQLGTDLSRGGGKALLSGVVPSTPRTERSPGPSRNVSPTPVITLRQPGTTVKTLSRPNSNASYLDSPRVGRGNGGGMHRDSGLDSHPVRPLSPMVYAQSEVSNDDDYRSPRSSKGSPYDNDNLSLYYSNGSAGSGNSSTRGPGYSRQRARSTLAAPPTTYFDLEEPEDVSRAGLVTGVSGGEHTPGRTPRRRNDGNRVMETHDIIHPHTPLGVLSIVRQRARMYEHTLPDLAGSGDLPSGVLEDRPIYEGHDDGAGKGSAYHKQGSGARKGKKTKYQRLAFLEVRAQQLEKKNAKLSSEFLKLTDFKSLQQGSKTEEQLAILEREKWTQTKEEVQELSQECKRLQEELEATKREADRAGAESYRHLKRIGDLERIDTTATEDDLHAASHSSNDPTDNPAPDGDGDGDGGGGGELGEKEATDGDSGVVADNKEPEATDGRTTPTAAAGGADKGSNNGPTAATEKQDPSKSPALQRLNKWKANMKAEVEYLEIIKGLLAPDNAEYSAEDLKKVEARVIHKWLHEMCIHMRRLGKLLSLGEVITESLVKMKDAMAVITEAACQRLGAARATVFAIDKKKNELYSFNQGEAQIRVPIHIGVAGYCFRTGEIINITDAYKDDRFNPEVDRQQGLKSKTILCAPINAHAGYRIGILQVINKNDGSDFTVKDEAIVEGLAIQAGVHLLQAETYEEAVSVAQGNPVLNTVMNSFVSEIKMSTALELLVDDVCNYLSADRATIFLADSKEQELYSVSASGDVDIRFPWNQGIAGRCFMLRDFVNVPDASRDPEFNAAFDKKTGYKTKALLCCPIFGSNGDCIGVIQAINKQLGSRYSFFSEDDHYYCKTIAVQAGFNIEYARLYQAALGKL